MLAIGIVVVEKNPMIHYQAVQAQTARGGRAGKPGQVIRVYSSLK